MHSLSVSNQEASVTFLRLFDDLACSGPPVRSGFHCVVRLSSCRASRARSRSF